MHPQRKLDHIKICLEHDVQAPGVTNGFERYHFIHKALPEISRDDVDPSADFLGKRLRAPILISAITGGTEVAAKINKNLAIAAQSLGLAMSVGSQRPAIENNNLAYSYRVRDIAPDILLFANLGAVQLNYGYGLQECRQVVQMIQADALVLHLNPLQECIQPGGDTNFANLLPRIGEICHGIGVPVIVKEVGCGISGDVAVALKAVGVAAIDVAGVGGTSWALVEKHRALSETIRQIADTFAGWGIPTAEAVSMVCQALPELPVIASGGIRTGIEAAKAIVLGADLVGLAVPLLDPAMNSSEMVHERLTRLRTELEIAMFCLGVRDLSELKKVRIDRG